jgi:hypothetical protein
MRAAPSCLPFLLASACGAVRGEPQVKVSPYYAVYQFGGDVSMQSAGPGGPEDNAPQSLRTFGLDAYEGDLGVRVDIGENFGGFRVDYFRLDQSTTRSGTLEDDWGALLAGDQVRMAAEMDEVRLGYVHPLLRERSNVRGHPLDLLFGLGAVLAHRELSLRAATTDGQRRQDIDIADHGVVYPAVRARAALQSFAIDAEYAFSPDLAFGGEFEGFQQDVEVRLSYTVPMHDVTFLAAWRYSDLGAAGDEGGYAYDADLTLSGFQFGVQVSF